MEYIGLNSESCKRADRNDRMEALRQSNRKYSVNSAICAKYIFSCVINGYTLRVTQMNPQQKSFAWQIKTLA